MPSRPPYQVLSRQEKQGIWAVSRSWDRHAKGFGKLAMEVAITSSFFFIVGQQQTQGAKMGAS